MNHKQAVGFASTVGIATGHHPEEVIPVVRAYLEARWDDDKDCGCVGPCECDVGAAFMLLADFEEES